MGDAVPPLTDAQRDRVDRVCSTAFDRPVAEWEAFVRAECDDDTRVRDEALGLLARITRSASTVEPAPSRNATDAAPERLGHVGPFELLRELGQGGFGVVYEAEQSAPVSRRVALKIIKPGMDSAGVVARFEAERQALAMMNHPNVARVFDGGVSEDGRPYFAMELVRGETIIEHCDNAELSIRDRVELFIEVCNAVQHAHAKGVVHRDIKPSNIIVETMAGEPTPKVIDFGIAKALDRPLDAASLTMQGQLIGTPQYMSPEQASFETPDIDTRSDVYSLGAVLYELLVGSPPFDAETFERAGLADVMRTVREVDPPKPSARLGQLLRTTGTSETTSVLLRARRANPKTLSRTFRVDLDWIVLRCLEKDRERRYETVEALAQDLRRFVRGEAVEAGPPDASYRLTKFARRHPRAIAAVGAAAVVLVGFSAVVSVLAVRTDRARRDAERALELASTRESQMRQVSSLQGDIVASIQLDQAAASVRSGLIESIRTDDQSETDAARAALKDALARASVTDAVRDLIAHHYLGALLERLEAETDDPYVSGNILDRIAQAYMNIGRYQQARDAAARAVEAWNRAGVGFENEVRSARLIHAQALMGIRDYDSALGVAEEMIALADAGVDLTADIYYASLDVAATALVGLGRPSEALGYRVILAEAYASDEDAPIAERVSVVASLAHAYAQSREFEEAGPWFVRAIELGEANIGEAGVDTATAYNNYGMFFGRQGQWDEAVVWQRKALETYVDVLGEEHRRAASAYYNTGFVLTRIGNYAEAETHFKRSADIFVMLQIPDYEWFTWHVRSCLGDAIAHQGRFEHAERILLEADANMAPPAHAARRHVQSAGRLATLYTLWDEAVADPARVDAAARWNAIARERSK